MSASRYPRVAAFKSAAAFRRHLLDSDIALRFDDELTPAGASPLATPIEVGSLEISSRVQVIAEVEPNL